MSTLYNMYFFFPEEMISAIKLFSIKMILRDTLCVMEVFFRHTETGLLLGVTVLFLIVVLEGSRACF